MRSVDSCLIFCEIHFLDFPCSFFMQHFCELLDDLSPDALLGQLLSDPFLSGVRGGVEAMEGEDEGDLSPSSPLPPHITAEHSYSLCGDSRPQSPLSHLTGEQGSEAGRDYINNTVHMSIYNFTVVSGKFRCCFRQNPMGIHLSGPWSRRNRP